MASNSRPSASICSSLRWARGLSMTLDSKAAPSGSEIDFDGPLRRADARPDHLPVLSIDLAVAQVAHLSRAELPDAGVADALATAERQLEPGLLAGDEDRRRTVGLGLAVTAEEGDRAALALLPEAELGLEALQVQALAVGLAVP